MDGLRPITADQILGIVENVLEIPVPVFTTKSRLPHLVDARKISAVLIHTYTPLAMSIIAMKLGMKPERHDTIIYYRNSLPDLLKTDKRLAMAYDCADEEIMRYISKGSFISDVISLNALTREVFVTQVMDVIKWKEKGTTRENLEVLYYKLFKLREFND